MAGPWCAWLGLGLGLGGSSVSGCEALTKDVRLLYLSRPLNHVHSPLGLLLRLPLLLLLLLLRRVPVTPYYNNNNNTIVVVLVVIILIIIIIIAVYCGAPSHPWFARPSCVL